MGNKGKSKEVSVYVQVAKQPKVRFSTVGRLALCIYWIPPNQD